MADNETIADIIAELRKRGECRERSPVVYDYADRLDAALKRERGDCAKLREALESIANNIERRLFTRYPSSATDEWMLRKAREALAAPARNCDVYNNESCRMAYHLNGDGLMTMQAFADWLFAPATEKEGGDK